MVEDGGDRVERCALREEDVQEDSRRHHAQTDLLQIGHRESSPDGSLPGFRAFRAGNLRERLHEMALGDFAGTNLFKPHGVQPCCTDLRFQGA